MVKTLVTLLLVHATCLTASADVRLTRLFGDHMILQQENTNAIRGFADPGEQVTVAASRAPAHACPYRAPTHPNRTENPAAAAKIGPS